MSNHLGDSIVQSLGRGTRVVGYVHTHFGQRMNGREMDRGLFE
jgi:hypothetical protein